MSAPAIAVASAARDSVLLGAEGETGSGAQAASPAMVVTLKASAMNDLALAAPALSRDGTE